MAAALIDLNATLTITLGLIVGILIGLIGFIIGKIVSPRKFYPLKNERFECGNPPKGRARGVFSMQYYGYLIVFLTIEPILIYTFIFLMDLHKFFFEASTLLSTIILIMIPPLIFGLSQARRVRLWTVKGVERVVEHS